MREHTLERLRSRIRTRAAALAMAVAAASATTAADALPGQSIAGFKQWSAGKPTLRGLAPTKDEMSGRPAFELTMSDHGVAWYFHASTNGSVVLIETLSVGTNGTTTNEAIRHDGRGYGFTFWKALYGAEVAADFLAATPVFSIPAAAGQTATTYYRGKRYGYITAGGLTVETPAHLAADVAEEKTCAAHPRACPGD
jgi:hypothetical protein